MLVRTIMTAPVVSVFPSDSILDAARLMLSMRGSGLPVVNDRGTLVGLVSEADLMRRELGTQQKRSWWLELLVSPGKRADEYVHANGRKVEEIMATKILTTGPDASLDDIVELMARHGVKRLPVLEAGEIVGIVSRADLLRALAGALPAGDEPASDDARIEAAIQSELAGQSWGGNGLIRAHAKDGAVELSGTIFDERERLAARIVAENVPGVKSVSDQLVWIEPTSGIVLLPLGGSSCQVVRA